MGSWWLSWEDLLFPEPGNEKKIIQKAKKFKEAGINTVIIFGCHFRWDFIYNWERFHNLLSFIVDCCHKEGIRVFDHHSANLTHRVDTIDEYRNINEKNRHHVPFFPSREFADTITFNGNKLNDFRMISVQDGKPCYLNTYNAEIYCMNNPNFVEAYKKYLEKLLSTGIDGLMCDDIVYYPRWDGCGCEHCREKFSNQYNHDLPPTSNEDFWGNYESKEFKDWINMRYNDPLDFLAALKGTIGADFPLMSCCSSSSLKALNSVGVSSEIMCNSLNNIMLEMCGEIVPENSDYFSKAPDLMLHKAIADKHNYPNIALGYAHNPDSAFIIWAFSKIFGSNAWISTLTGRLGLSEAVRKAMPDEAEIIQEAYNFERKHENLFIGESVADIAVLFSIDNLMYNGCEQSNYSQPWHDITIELLKNNLQFEVVIDIPSATEKPLLLLCNFDCISAKFATKLHEYLRTGGEIIATGLLGCRDEYGVIKEKQFMADYGVEIKNIQCDWNIPNNYLFDRENPLPKRKIQKYKPYLLGSEIESEKWIDVNKLHWIPEARIESTIDKVNALLPNGEIKVTSPEGWIYRIFKDFKNNKYLVHLLAANIEAIPYKKLKNNLTNQTVIEQLKFVADSGKVYITSSASKAVLHSPDLSKPVEIEPVNGEVKFELNNIKRYLIIELQV